MAQHSAAIAKVFQNSSDLSSFLSTECKKRQIPWEAVSKDVAAMKAHPEPHYVFPDDLQFTVDVSAVSRFPRCLSLSLSPCLFFSSFPLHFIILSLTVSALSLSFSPSLFQVTLNESKCAYKNLLSGLEKNTILEMLKLEKYQPLRHSDPAMHPLRQFQYTDVIRDWMREDSKLASN